MTAYKTRVGHFEETEVRYLTTYMLDVHLIGIINECSLGINDPRMPSSDIARTGLFYAHPEQILK